MLSHIEAETESFSRAHVGIHIVNLKTGNEIFSQNADKYFVPASLQKLLISFLALSYLDEDFTFKTTLSYDGQIKDGTLYGNLRLEGGGDPTFSLETLGHWCEELKAKGIHRIEGKIIVDSSCFEKALASPYWNYEDIGNYYGAGASGISINQNQYSVTFKPGVKEGDPTTVLALNPPQTDLEIFNEVKTGPVGSGDKVVIFGSEYFLKQFYRGTIPVDEPTFTVKGAIPNPSLFCGRFISEKIPAKGGIECLFEPQDKAQNHRLFTQSSKPLKELLFEMNTYSNNLFAEHILKQVGKGRASVGADLLETLLKERGILAVIKDGAGGARSNLISPKGMVKLLVEIRQNPKFESVYHSLPEIGKAGSLEFFPPLHQLHLKAKTGSMSQVFNLAGFLKNSRGQEFAFAIFCNHYKGSIAELKKVIASLIEKFELVE